MSDANGRDSLFGGVPGRRPPAGAAGKGRHALFSAPPRQRGDVIVECSTCEARTPVPLVELAPRLLPSVWIPGRAFSRLIKCPACGRRTWCRVHWRTLAAGS